MYVHEKSFKTLDLGGMYGSAMSYHRTPTPPKKQVAMLALEWKEIEYVNHDESHCNEGSDKIGSNTDIGAGHTRRGFRKPDAVCGFFRPALGPNPRAVYGEKFDWSHWQNFHAPLVQGRAHKKPYFCQTCLIIHYCRHVCFKSPE